MNEVRKKTERLERGENKLATIFLVIFKKYFREGKREDVRTFNKSYV